MTVFVDTSGFYAVFDRDDAHHGRAAKVWSELLASGAALITNNYVLVETIALLQHRTGLASARAFHTDVMPLLEVDWIDQQRHRAGVEAMLAAGRKKLSLVGSISFQTMRERDVRTAFSFEAHFREQGFATLP